MLTQIDHRACPFFACLSLLVMVVAAYSQAVPPQTAAPQPSAPQTAPQAAPQAPAATPAAPSTPPVAPPPAAPASNPGLVEEFNKLLKKSADGLSSTFSWTVKGSQQSFEDLNARAKDATDSLTRVQSVVTGRSSCPVSSNGAPDCESASEKMCKAKGYKSGKSLDIETAEKCSAKVYISGRTGAPGECRTENFVTRAVCQ
jgi:hypothetical protein